VTSLLNI
jgi:hypothetical protein